MAGLLSLLSRSLWRHGATAQRDIVDGTTIGDTELCFVAGRWRSVGTVRLGDIGGATHVDETGIKRLESQLKGRVTVPSTADCAGVGECRAMSPGGRK